MWAVAVKILCACGHSFKANADTYYATQVIPSIQTVLLFNCPNLLSDGSRCGSSRGVVLWESFELAIHFGEAALDEDEDLPMAAE